MYKWNWWEFYDKIIQSPEYEKYQKEIQLIQENSSELNQYITKHLTDIWCGNWEKVVYLLKSHPNIKNLNYIASDYSANILELAENNINTQLPDLKMGNHQIMRSWNELFTNNLDENTYLRLGCTIWNFYKEQIVSHLKNMNNRWTLKWNMIIFSYFDKPQNKEEIQNIIDLYQNTDANNFLFNGLKNLWLDTNHFNFIVEYSIKDNCLYVWVQVKEDYQIRLESWKEINLKKWEKFFIHQSKRFWKQEIEEILKEAWAKIEKHISKDGISIIVAKKDPKYYKKTLQIIWFTSLLLLATLGWAIWYKAIDNHKKKEKSEEIAKEKIKEYDINFRFDGAKTLRITSIDEKERYLHNITDAFVSAYWKWEMDEEDIYYMIVDRFWPNSFKYQTYWKDRFQKLNFINREVILDNKVKLQNNWIDLQPYSHLSEYEDAFINSRLDTTNTNPQHSQTEIHRWWWIADPTEINKIWEYTSIHGTQYEIWYITRNREPWKNKNHYSWDFSMWKSKRYLVAKFKDDKKYWFSEKYSVQRAKDLCEDYFIWTRPQIQTSYDIIMMSCKSDNKTWYINDNQRDNIQEIIIEYFIKNKIPRDTASKYMDKVYPPDLLDLVYNKLLKDETNKFKEIWIDPVPYNIFHEFIDAFQNSQEYRDLWNKARWANDFLAPDYKELAKYNQNYISDYIDQDGNSFSVYYITVEWKRYIIANETNNKYSSDSPSILYWTQVRKDFQKNHLNKK